jgi:hypothetical protein
MKLSHWITKRLVKDNRRIFFKVENPVPAEILLTFRGLFNIQVYYAQVDFKAEHYWFYIDVPKSVSDRTFRFDCIVHQNKKEVWSGTFKISGKFEDLYEGKKT